MAKALSDSWEPRRNVLWCKGCEKNLNVSFFGKGARTRGKKISRLCMDCKGDDKTRWVETALHSAKQRAVKKSLEFDLTGKQIEIPDFCPVLGSKLVYSERKMSSAVRRMDDEHQPSLDRIDNSKGYVAGNVRIISYRANRLKNDASSPEELLKVIRYMKSG